MINFYILQHVPVGSQSACSRSDQGQAEKTMYKMRDEILKIHYKNPNCFLARRPVLS